MNRISIPAESAVTISLAKGQRCRVVNTEGGGILGTYDLGTYDLNSVNSGEFWGHMT